MPVEQVLVRADQKGAAAARRIEHAQLRRLRGRFAFQPTAHRVTNDVVDNKRGRVVDASRLADLRLLFDLGSMPLGKPDHLAQKLFVDLTQNLRGQHGKLVRTFGIVQAADDVFQRLVVDRKPQGQFVGRLVAVLLGREVEQAGVVALVRTLEEFGQSAINASTVRQRLKAPVRLDAAIFANPQEHDPIDRPLDGEIQVPLRKVGIAAGGIAGQQIAPRLDFRQERGIDFRCALLDLLAGHETVQGPAADRLRR